jgi:hypothetical protein
VSGTRRIEPGTPEWHERIRRGARGERQRGFVVTPEATPTTRCGASSPNSRTLVAQEREHSNVSGDARRKISAIADEELAAAPSIDIDCWRGGSLWNSRPNNWVSRPRGWLEQQAVI